MTKSNSLLRRLDARFGRRRSILLAFAIAWAGIAVKALLEPSTDDGRFMLYTLLPAVARFVLWGIPAVVAFVLAMRKTIDDGVAWGLLYLPAMVLCLGNLISFIAYLTGVTDYYLGIVSALQWALYVFIIFRISGWAEPTQLSGVRPHGLRKQTVVILDENGGDDE